MAKVWVRTQKQRVYAVRKIKRLKNNIKWNSYNVENAVTLIVSLETNSMYMYICLVWDTVRSRFPRNFFTLISYHVYNCIYFWSIYIWWLPPKILPTVMGLWLFDNWYLTDLLLKRWRFFLKLLTQCHECEMKVYWIR